MDCYRDRVLAALAVYGADDLAGTEAVIETISIALHQGVEYDICAQILLRGVRQEPRAFLPMRHEI
jgi:hypothetical protein